MFFKWKGLNSGKQFHLLDFLNSGKLQELLTINDVRLSLEGFKGTFDKSIGIPTYYGYKKEKIELDLYRGTVEIIRFPANPD